MNAHQYSLSAVWYQVVIVSHVLDWTTSIRNYYVAAFKFASLLNGSSECKDGADFSSILSAFGPF